MYLTQIINLLNTTGIVYEQKVILRGMSAILPLCIGDFPFSFIVGALSVSAGMSIWQSTAWSTIVIAGSAQMLALNMLKTGRALG